jgi:hypothetical protein
MNMYMFVLAGLRELNGHRRSQRPLLGGTLSRHTDLCPESREIEIPSECFVECRLQRQRWPFIGDVSDVILRNSSCDLASHRQTPNAEREQHTHAHDL